MSRRIELLPPPRRGRYGQRIGPGIAGGAPPGDPVRRPRDRKRVAVPGAGVARGVVHPPDAAGDVVAQRLQVARQPGAGGPGDLLAQGQEEGHGAVPYGDGLLQGPGQGGAVVVREDVDEVLVRGLVVVLLGIGEQVVVAAHDEARGLGEGLDGGRGELLVGDLGAAGDLVPRQREARSVDRRPQGDVVGERGHDAPFDVADLPRRAEEPVAHPLGHAAELDGAGHGPGPGREVLQRAVEGGGAEHRGARCLQASRYPGVEVDDPGGVDVGGTGVVPEVVEGEGPVVPLDEQQQRFVPPVGDHPAAEVGAVGGDAPGPFGRVAEDAAAVQPGDRPLLQLRAPRMDGGFDRAVEGRQPPADRRGPRRRFAGGSGGSGGIREIGGRGGRHGQSPSMRNSSMRVSTA